MTPTGVDGPGYGRFDAAVHEASERGAADPRKIVATLVKRHGLDWLTETFAEMIVQVAERRAADILRNERRAAERQATKQARTEAAEYAGKPTGKPTATKNLRKKLREQKEEEETLYEDLILKGYFPVERIARKSVFIEERGWIKMGDCTSADLRSRARMYVKQAGTLTKRSVWNDQTANEMDARGAVLLIDLGYAPPVPDGETPEAMADEEAA